MSQDAPALFKDEESVDDPIDTGLHEQNFINDMQMRKEWSDRIKAYIQWSTIITLAVVTVLFVIDVILLFQATNPAYVSERVVDKDVILALIAASVAQVGVISVVIGNYLFK